MKKPLTIALIGPAYPLRGGIAHHSACLAQALTRRGNTVHFFSFKRQYPSFLFPGKTQFDSSRDILQCPNDPTLNPLNPWTWGALARKIIKLKPSLAVFAWWNPFLAPAYAFITKALEQAQIKVCFLCHNVQPHERSALGRWLSNLAFRRVKSYVVQSSAAKADLAKLLPAAKVAFAPHPAYGFFLAPKPPSREESRRRWNLPPDGKILLFFGHIRPYKGLDVLLRAMPGALEREPSAHLLVAGEFYEKPAPYLRLIKDLYLKPRVTLLDRYIPNEDVASLFSASDAAVLPYRSASASGVAATAAAFGVPVLATRAGGLPDSVQEGITGFLVEPENPLALAEGIQKVLRLAAAGRAASIKSAAAEYSWERLAEAVEQA